MNARQALERVGLSTGYGRGRTHEKRATIAAPAPTLNDAITAFLRALENRNRSGETINTYRAALGRFQEWLHRQEQPVLCADLTHALAERYLDFLRHDYVSVRGTRLSDCSIHHYIAVLKTFAEWGARGSRFWSGSPLEDFDVPTFVETEIEPYSQTELAALVAACGSQKSFAGRRLLALLLTALDTGMRRGELRQLTVEMLDLRTGRIRLPASITKTRRARTVHVQQTALTTIKEWLVARDALPAVDPDRGPLFCQLSGTAISDGAMDQLAARLRNRSGVERFRWHLLRHTCGTVSLRNGADSLDVQETLGHTTSRMTLRYLHLTDDDRRARHARYSPVQALMGKAEPRESRFRGKAP